MEGSLELPATILAQNSGSLVKENIAFLARGLYYYQSNHVIIMYLNQDFFFLPPIQFTVTYLASALNYNTIFALLSA